MVRLIVTFKMFLNWLLVVVAALNYNSGTCVGEIQKLSSTNGVHFLKLRYKSMKIYKSSYFI